MSMRALGAELIGTFALVTALCGAWQLTAAVGGGLVAVALAVGLSVLAMSYALGHVSGAHFNPAVTLGLVAAGRFDMSRALGFILAQVVGATLAALIFATILSGAPAGSKWSDFAAIANGYGGPAKFSLTAAFLIEVVTTALFLVVVVGATSRKAPAGFAPLAIGLAMALSYLVTIPVTNASLNPARSTATAVLAGTPALAQLWVFWLAPMIGGIVGGVLGRWLQDE